MLRSYTSQNVHIRSNVEMPKNVPDECKLPAGRLDFKWRFNLARTVEGFPLDAKTRYTKNLFIPKGTMVAGESYYFQVEASVAGHPELWNEANAIVEIEYSRLDISLEYKKEIDVFEDFVINATASFDPDDPRPEDPQPPFGPFTFKWECAPWDPNRRNYLAIASCFQVKAQLFQ